MRGVEERQSWSKEAIKCLLDVCIDEINKVGRNGGSFHKDSWVKLSIALKEKFGMDVNQKQMKNAFDTLKAKYVGWVYLRNKTGNIYNPHTNMFTLTTQEWEAFKKGHPRAASLRTQPLPYPDLCALLYDTATPNGDNQWSSTQTCDVSSSTQRIQTLQIEDIPFTDVDDDDGDSRAQGASQDGSEIPTTQDGSEIPTTQDAPNSSSAPTVDEGRPKKRAKTSVTLDDLALDMQQALRHMVKNKEGPTTDECYEKLKLVGLDPTDPLFLAAFNIFGQSIQMRESWMTLPPNPEVLKGWIKLTGLTYGMFK